MKILRSGIDGSCPIEINGYHVVEFHYDHPVDDIEALVKDAIHYGDLPTEGCEVEFQGMIYHPETRRALIYWNSLHQTESEYDWNSLLLAYRTAV